jgi:tetratricopeptide (TPR) repeat protein
MALLALVAIVYAPVKKGVFLWDDHAMIETSKVVHEGSVAEIFRRPFWTGSSLSDVRPSYYRPVTMLSLRADYAAFGDDAGAFHVTNLLLHLLATLALALVARRFGASPVASVLAAGVWALHPRTTEAVAWISGRGDVLAGLMAIAALGIWPWYGTDDERKPSSSRIRAVVASLALLIGLLAKEVEIAAVVAITLGTLLGARADRPEGRMRVVRRLAFLVPPLAAYAVLRGLAMRGVSSHLTPLGVEARTATVVEALGRYLEMIFDPWHPATSIGLVGEIDAGSVTLGAMALALGAALVARALVRLRRDRPDETTTDDHGSLGARRGAMAALAAAGLTSLMLVVHVIPIALAAGVAADRLLYLPLAALAIALAVLSEKLSPRARTVAGALAVALAATFVPVTRARAADYADELRFRLVAAEHAHPSNTSAKSGLANMLRAEAEVDLACRMHASVRSVLERSGRIKTTRYIRALENLGGCYAALGSYGQAGETYAAIQHLEPDHPRVHMELGFLGLHTFDLDRAEAELRRAIELDPKLAPARATLEALPELRPIVARFATDEARRADPAGWARLLTSLGRIPDASKAWAAVLADPATDDATAFLGIQHLLANADLDTARRLVEPRIRREVFGAQLAREKLAERVRERARIDQLRPRLEALANQ